MTVWDKARGTIPQFSKAIASEPHELDADEIYNDILSAFWRNEFEGQVSFPEDTEIEGEWLTGDLELLKRIERGILPTKLSRLAKRYIGMAPEERALERARLEAEGSVWLGDVTTVQPCPFEPITREDLRRAVAEFSELKSEFPESESWQPGPHVVKGLWRPSVTRRDHAVKFEWLAMRRAAEYGANFRRDWLDKLFVETAAVGRWRARTTSSATETRAQWATSPAPAEEPPLPSPLPPADPWELLIEDLPDRDLIRTLPGKIALAAVAVTILFKGERPSMPAMTHLEKVNEWLKANGQPSIGRDTLSRAYQKIKDWRRDEAARGYRLR